MNKICFLNYLKLKKYEDRIDLDNKFRYINNYIIHSKKYNKIEKSRELNYNNFGILINIIL